MLNCSCTTNANSYWSATTYVAGAYAWTVNFKYGYVDADSKANGYYVRAVRGGS